MARLEYLLIALLTLTTSCVPTEKLIYLQSDATSLEPELGHSAVEYKLQVNDILDVQILSMDPEINTIFNSSNLGTAQTVQASVRSGGDLFYLTGYSVSADGAIDIPFVGKVQVLNLTLTEARHVIDGAVSSLFSNYHLKVKLGGVRFSTIGEFNIPSKHVVMQNQVTIFEAIALSGDLTSVANRASIKVIRQNANSSQILTVNLLDRSSVTSDVYFIQPNDVIYAEPLPQRSWGFGVTGSETLSAVISTLSTSAALVLSIISLTQ